MNTQTRAPQYVAWDRYGDGGYKLFSSPYEAQAFAQQQGWEFVTHIDDIAANPNHKLYHELIRMPSSPSLGAPEAIDFNALYQDNRAKQATYEGESATNLGPQYVPYDQTAHIPTVIAHDEGTPGAARLGEQFGKPVSPTPTAPVIYPQAQAEAGYDYGSGNIMGGETYTDPNNGGLRQAIPLARPERQANTVPVSPAPAAPATPPAVTDPYNQFPETPNFRVEEKVRMRPPVEIAKDNLRQELGNVVLDGSGNPVRAGDGYLRTRTDAEIERDEADPWAWMRY